MPIFSPDPIDIKILEALQANGRITNQELADQVGLSPSPCLRRVRHLESEGVISRYVALVDPEALDLNVTAFVRVRLDQHLMTGESDYQLRVLVRSLTRFEDFLRNSLTRVSGVANVTTSFALRPVIYKTALPTLDT